jgi:IS1 family transposase
LISYFGTQEYENFDKLLALLKPFDITIVYIDNTVVYQSRVTNGKVVTGEKNTQKIERKYLSLRTCGVLLSQEKA